MKIIDLLIKIANGEETPKKIMWKDELYDNDVACFLYEYIGDCSNKDIKLKLNCNVDIIEEDKKIEKLNNIPINYTDDRTPEEVYEYLRCTINNLANVINISNENLFELIDKVNSLEKEQ